VLLYGELFIPNLGFHLSFLRQFKETTDVLSLQAVHLGLACFLGQIVRLVPHPTRFMRLFSLEHRDVFESGVWIRLRSKHDRLVNPSLHFGGRLLTVSSLN
jgi:hypothetical protein